MVCRRTEGVKKSHLSFDDLLYIVHVPGPGRLDRLPLSEREVVDFDSSASEE